MYENGDTNWYAIQVKTGLEMATGVALRAKGYEDFVPTYWQRRKWSDRYKNVEVPLFAGYTFCRFTASILAPILTTSGVIRIVGFGKTPAPIDEGEINALRIIVAARANAEPWPFLKVGQRVTVNSGPLRGIVGVIQSFNGCQRLVITVSLLMRSIGVDMDSFSVDPAAEYPNLTQNLTQTAVLSSR